VVRKKDRVGLNERNRLGGTECVWTYVYRLVLQCSGGEEEEEVPRQTLHFV